MVVHDPREVFRIARLAEHDDGMRNCRRRFNARHDNDRDVARERILRKLADDRPAAHGREHKIQKDQIRPTLFQCAQRAETISCASGIDSSKRERGAVKVGEVGIVLYDENPRIGSNGGQALILADGIPPLKLDRTTRGARQSGALFLAPLRAPSPVRPIGGNVILASFAGHLRFDLGRHLLRLLHHIVEPCQQRSEFFWCQFGHEGAHVSRTELLTKIRVFGIRRKTHQSPNLGA